MEGGSVIPSRGALYAGVPDEYPMKPVFDGAQQSRRVRSGHSRPALISQNPRFWFRINDV